MGLTRELLEKLFIYDKDNGVLRNRYSWSRKSKIGKVAGTVRKDGYVKIGIDYKIYFVHRLIWMLETGEFPKTIIDHINRNTSDNRFCNLREASVSENGFNRGLNKNNKTGERNIRINKSGSFLVELTVDKRCKYFGSYKTLDEAVNVRNELKELYK